MRRPATCLVLLPPLQGEGWGGDGVGVRASPIRHPIPLPASPLKGEVTTPASPLMGEEKLAARGGRAQE
jgi:hypothetical protein